MGREDGKAGAGWLVLIRSAEGPECNWPAAKLCEPRLQLRLGGVVWKTAHVQNLAALGQECPHVSTGVHWAGKHIRVLVWWLRLANESTKNPGKGNSLLHRTAWGCWCQGLQVEWQVVLDWCRRLNWLDLKGSADVGQGTGTKWKRLRMVRLPSLVLRAEVKGTGVLEVWWKYNSLVSCLPWELYAEIPGIEGNKGELVVLGDKMLIGELVETVDGITE